MKPSPFLRPDNRQERPRTLGFIPRWERSPGGGHGNRVQYSCLENPLDRGAWWATVHGVAKSRTGCAIEHTINQKMKDHINAPTVFGCALSQHRAFLVAQLVKNCAMGETWVPSVGWEDALEKGKATYSSILAWRIQWTLGRCREAPLASIRQMSRQVSRGSAGEYQADEQAGVAGNRWQVSGR